MNEHISKHLKLSLLIAPVLSLMSYGAVDRALTQEPKPAVKGEHYPLRAKSNCRYQSGRCSLVNGDVELQLIPNRTPRSEVELTLSSNLELQTAQIAYSGARGFHKPTRMLAETEDRHQLTVTLPLLDPQKSQFRLAVVIAGSYYTAETSAIFVEREVAFMNNTEADPSALASRD